jgi:chemotaxis receptor (MCP) glutamine deamidase CheD
MFALLEGDQHGIGWKNTETAREELRKFGITIETEVVGGTVGRNMRFDCSTGLVEIITKV